jgi:hypothetical protein
MTGVPYALALTAGMLPPSTRAASPCCPPTLTLFIGAQDDDHAGRHGPALRRAALWWRQPP